MHKLFVPAELAVVTGILALGALTVIPAVSGKMRALAALDTCAANLKGFHAAIAAYADENEGFTPEAQPGSGSRRNWWKLLQPNLDPLPGMADWGNPGCVNGKFGIFKCPENTKQIYLANFFGPQDPRTQSYTANTFNGFNESRYMGEKIERMKYPTQLIALFEGNYPRVVVWNETESSSAPKVSDPRHGGSMNILYADGHVALHKGALSGRGEVIDGSAGEADQFTNGKIWYSR